MAYISDSDLYNKALEVFLSSSSRIDSYLESNLGNREISEIFQDTCESNEKLDHLITPEIVKNLSDDFTDIMNMNESDYERDEDFFNEKKEKERIIISKLRDALGI